MQKDLAVRKNLAIAGIVPAIIATLTICLVSAQAPRTLEHLPSTGRVVPPGEPGTPINVTGVVVNAGGTPVSGASIYVYQTDAEGYYGVKPVSDNRNPRLKLRLQSDGRGAWSFETIRPGSYPNSRIPAHIHFEVAAPGHANRNFEIVFEGDPFVTAEMRTNPAFSVRPIEAGGKVTERIVLTAAR